MLELVPGKWHRTHHSGMQRSVQAENVIEVIKGVSFRHGQQKLRAFLVLSIATCARQEVTLLSEALLYVRIASLILSSSLPLIMYSSFNTISLCYAYHVCCMNLYHNNFYCAIYTVLWHKVLII